MRVTARVFLVVLVLLADQGDLLEEVRGVASGSALELAGHPDQLLEVLDPALASTVRSSSSSAR